MKQFAALARVSSREQEREGFSLEVQEEGLKRYAAQAGGEIVKLFRIAETASKGEQRKTFRELIAYAKKNAPFLDGLLFYKVDRASRNLFDYVELERLESEYNLPFISVSQPTENTPAGRMMRRTLANMASFYTEQQSVDVREGLSRRVREGWFIGLAPYGYRNVRKDGRGIIETDAEQAANVKRIYHLYAYENLTLDGVVEKINAEGRIWRKSQPTFPRSSVHNILKDRAYIGEISHKGEWYPGKHEPLIDRATWNRVQALLGGHVYQSQTHTYAGQLIQCGHCGHPITGETITKKTKNGERYYTYYRCTYYNRKDHPRIRVREADLEQQVLAIFDKMKVENDDVRDWFRLVLASQTRDAQAESFAQRGELQRQETLLVQQQDRLLNMRLSDDIDQETFARKHTELRDRLSSIKLQLDVVDRSHDETAELAAKVFELSQTLRNQWLTADYAAKRRILEIVFLNCVLDDVSLVPTMRKPFDVLAEGLISEKSRGDRIRTEGTAVGFNKKKKGARSSYPLFCTLAQTAQVLDFLHRSGNVHDSHGAREFILACVQAVRAVLPQAVIEVRMDSAFFSDEIVSALNKAGVEFTLSVPFERFVELKEWIDARRQWYDLGGDVWAFTLWWKPKAWDRPCRFVFVRTRAKRQQKGPVQLDLFVPYEHGYDFKVIVTNKPLSMKPVIVYHGGRGSQEGVFAELKTHCAMGYVPVRSWLGNQAYLLAGLLAHNLIREFQRQTASPCRKTTPKRAALWKFERLGTFRSTILPRAGRLTRPQGRLTLTVSAASWLQARFLHFLRAFDHAA